MNNKLTELTLKLYVGRHIVEIVDTVLVPEANSVGRFEWSWCPFACFKG